MPKLDKAIHRERAQERARRGMRTSGRSVFTIQRRVGERAAVAKAAQAGRRIGAGAPRGRASSRRATSRTE